jgi:hypothetical protein
MPRRNRYEETPGWLLELIAAGIEKAGSEARLAAEIECSRSALAAWSTGSVPGVDKFEALIEYAGGSLLRALPGHETADERALMELTAENARLRDHLHAIAGTVNSALSRGIPPVLLVADNPHPPNPGGGRVKI